MKKFHGLVLIALLTSLIIPFSLAASAETNENGNNVTPTEDKSTDTTKNTITEDPSKTPEPPKEAPKTKTTEPQKATEPQKNTTPTTIDITDSAEVYSYEQNDKIALKDFTDTLTTHTGTKLVNYR
ncbi:TPA: cell surface protein, partial [Listeria innocua]|nr:cell surface protein [Listeria innocua]